jgi:hypothetical protein
LEFGRFYRSTRKTRADGQISEYPSSPGWKNILIFRSGKSVVDLSHPVPTRGALRNVINVERAAVAVEGAFDEGA